MADLSKKDFAPFKYKFSWNWLIYTRQKSLRKTNNNRELMRPPQNQKNNREKHNFWLTDWLNDIV